MWYSMGHCIIRDDSEYLDEWLTYHFALGFEHFVIYDHESIIPLVNRWGDKVTVIRIDGVAMISLPRVYNRTLEQFKGRAVWIGTFDLDEFIVLSKHNSINDLLVNYEEYGGLGINWLIYGSSGHISKPEGSVKDNYLWRTPPEFGGNDHVKTISQMKYCQDIFNVHTCTSLKPLVNEDYGVAHGLSWSTRTLCHINHYTIKSLEDWERKVALGIKVGCSQHWPRSAFEIVDNACTIFDDTLKGR